MSSPDPTAPSRPQSILLPPMSPDPGGLTPNKLKRLSLVASSSARPASLDLDRTDRRGLALSPRSTDGNPLSALSVSASATGSASASASASPRVGGYGYGVGGGIGGGGAGGDGPSTPRTGRKGVRSSISYSPAPRTPGYAEPGASKREVQLNRTAPESGIRSEDNAGEADEREDKEAERVKAKSKSAQTLTDKHADLLTLIAQRERRVNELRQELAAQESSLAQLKSRWTTIISRSTRPSVTQSSASTSTATGPPSSSSSSTHPARPGSTSSSGSSAISSLATLPESPESSWTTLVPGSNAHSASGVRSRPFLPSQPVGEDQGVFQSLINTASAIGADNLINPQAIQEGKKFWGQLVKTVSAAAGGTVPISSSSSSNPDQSSSAVPVSDGRAESRDGNPGHPNAGGGDGTLGKLDLNSLKSILTPWQAASSSPLSPPPAPSNASRLPRARPNGIGTGTSAPPRSAAGSTGSSTPRSATSFSSISVQQEPRQKMHAGADVQGDTAAPKRHMRRGVPRLAPAAGAMKGLEEKGLKYQDEAETSRVETSPIEWDIMAPDHVASEAPTGGADKTRAVNGKQEGEDEDEDEWGW